MCVQTVLVFSALGVPLSTTHCAVGSTVGVGLLEPKICSSSSCSSLNVYLSKDEGHYNHQEQEEEREMKRNSIHQKRDNKNKLKHKFKLKFCKLFNCLNFSSVNWRLFGSMIVSWVVTLLFSCKYISFN